MARNPNFSQKVKSEQNLYEDIIIESMKIYGQDVYYLPRTIVNENTILGEDVASSFTSSYKIEMYLENTEGFEGEGDLFTKFGVEIRDEATFIVARKRWSQTVASSSNAITVLRPKEGDLIWLSLSNKLFEILHVEHESPFYQLSNLPTYKMRCQLFEYSGEDLDTGIADVNSIQSDFGYRVSLTMDSDGIPRVASDGTTVSGFIIGENITQTFTSGTILTGEVAAWSDSDNILHLVNFGADDGAFHLPVVGRQVVGATSNNTTTVTAVSEELKQNENEQNSVFETTNDVMSFLDFSETNPFGDVQ
ncbi:hypothetical protein N8455_00185 [Candidatus Gracilibacteria bacterium]|jgi:hypothetical protein|nr:hypothetical protein [Candidatus Gracilibacteria bacterium]